MNPGVRFFTCFFGLLLLGAATPALLNLAFDPARVLHRDYYRSYPEILPNVRFLKVAYLLENPGRYDSFVFGSSRVRFGIPVDELGSSWFKLDFPGAAPAELRPTLALLKKRGAAVREVWIGLDDFALYDHLRDGEKDFFLRHHPDGAVESLSFYRFFLYRRPSRLDWQIFGRFVHRAPLLVPSLRIVGERAGIPLTIEDAAAHDRRILGETTQLRYVFNWPARTPELLAEIDSLVRFCEREGIALRVFVTPRHAKALYWRNYDDIDDFKRGLARIVDFHDFALLDAYATDNRYWHESSHFSPELGARVVRAIREERDGEPGMGRRVTTRNVEAHLQSHRESLRAAMPRLLELDPGIEIHESLLDRRPVLEGKRASALRIAGESAVTVLSREPALRVRVAASKGLLRLAPVSLADPETLYLKIQIESKEAAAVRLVTHRDADRDKRPSRVLHPGPNTVFAPIHTTELARGPFLLLTTGEFEIGGLELRRLAAVPTAAAQALTLRSPTRARPRDRRR